jgi:protein-arginine kinase
MSSLVLKHDSFPSCLTKKKRQSSLQQLTTAIYKSNEKAECFKMVDCLRVSSVVQRCNKNTLVDCMLLSIQLDFHINSKCTIATQDPRIRIFQSFLFTEIV